MNQKVKENEPKSPKEEVRGKTILEGDSNRKLKNVKKELVNNKTFGLATSNIPQLSSKDPVTKTIGIRGLANHLQKM